MKRRLLPFGIWIFSFLAAAAVFCTPDASGVSANSTAVNVVEGLHDLLIKSMKAGEKDSCPDRYHMLEPYILNAFDFPLISRIVLGRYWKKMDVPEQKRFVNIFSRMTVATYAERFDSYSGQSFKTVNAGPDSRRHFRVKTVLVKRNGEEISLDYTCRETGGRWKIVSVSAKGVNDLSLKRADYSSFLKKHSVDELISKLDEKARKCVSVKKKNDQK